jgi:hypothetical protein
MIVLFAHSYMRWAVLALACAVVAATAVGASRKLAWTRVHERVHVALVGATDLQFTLGLLLYLWLSPFVRGFFADPGSAMKNPVLRFFGLEHVLAMVVAVAVLHVGRTRSKRSAEARLRHRRALVSTLIALLLFAIAVPWPFLPYGRPLVRALS